MVAGDLLARASSACANSSCTYVSAPSAPAPAHWAAASAASRPAPVPHAARPTPVGREAAPPLPYLHRERREKRMKVRDIERREIDKSVWCERDVVDEDGWIVWI